MRRGIGGAPDSADGAASLIFQQALSARGMPGLVHPSGGQARPSFRLRPNLPAGSVAAYDAIRRSDQSLNVAGRDVGLG